MLRPAHRLAGTTDECSGHTVSIHDSQHTVSLAPAVQVAQLMVLGSSLCTTQAGLLLTQ